MLFLTAGCVLALPRSAGLWGATDLQRGGSLLLLQEGAAGSLCWRKTNSCYFHEVFSCVILFALEDKMYGPGLCFWLNRVQVQCYWTNTHTMMNCCSFYRKVLLMSWASVLWFRFLERSCIDTGASRIKDLPSGAANGFNNWNMCRSCSKELVFFPSLAVSCTANHLKEKEFFNPLFQKALDFFVLFNSLRSPISANKRPEEEDEAAKRKTQKRDLQR